MITIEFKAKGKKAGVGELEDGYRIDKFKIETSQCSNAQDANPLIFVKMDTEETSKITAVSIAGANSSNNPRATGATATT